MLVALTIFMQESVMRSVAMLSETTVGIWTFFRFVVFSQAIKAKSVLPYSLSLLPQGFGLQNRTTRCLSEQN